MKLSNVKKSIITAACIALCVVLPMAFHAIPNAGSIYSPMHIPVLLCGLICGGWYGMFCGIAGTLLSSLLTGMPPAAYMPSMMIELVVYGLICGVVMRYLHTKRLYADLYISLVIAILIGRIVAGLCKAFIFTKGSYSIALWVTSYFVTSFPAIVIQLALIPTIVVALEKSGLIPKRYK